MWEPEHWSPLLLVSLDFREGGRRGNGDVRGAEDAVAEGAEGHGLRAAVLHLQHRDVVDDGRGDGGDEEENCRGEEQEGADVVEDTHDCGVIMYYSLRVFGISCTS